MSRSRTCILSFTHDFCLASDLSSGPTCGPKPALQAFNSVALSLVHFALLQGILFLPSRCYATDHEQ